MHPKIAIHLKSQIEGLGMYNIQVPYWWVDSGDWMDNLIICLFRSIRMAPNAKESTINQKFVLIGDWPFLDHIQLTG